MRKILFRGKRVANGEWEFGSFVSPNMITAPMGEEIYGSDVVDPETVGQYTGLTDKNGEKIFEGDIIEVDRIYDTPQPRPRRFEVEWEESSGFFPLTVCRDGGDYFIDTDYCKIIGNIHDNPELLEVETNAD